MGATYHLWGLPVAIAVMLFVQLIVWRLWAKDAAGSTATKTVALVLVGIVAVGVLVTVIG